MHDSTLVCDAAEDVDDEEDDEAMRQSLVDIAARPYTNLRKRGGLQT